MMVGSLRARAPVGPPVFLFLAFVSRSMSLFGFQRRSTLLPCAPRRRPGRNLGTTVLGAVVCSSTIWAGVAAGQNPFAPTPTPATPAPGTPATPAPASSAPAANPFAPAAPAPAAPSATPPVTSAPVPAASGQAAAPAQPSGGYRKLARGVETTIVSPVTASDRSSRHDVVEVLAENANFGERPMLPNYKPMRNVHFKHDVWGLQFTFKPIRFLRVQDAKGNERLIWYMVYHVRNDADKPFLFLPKFALESHDVQKLYEERILPEAIPLIQAREDKNRKLLSTAEISGEIPSSTPEIDRSIWGVVTWEGIDPRTDRFSIFVDGLTNAYRWDDPPGGYQAGDPPGKGRVYQHQVLKMNFWRPSDTRFAHEDEIRFGIPGEVDYEWFYK